MRALCTIAARLDALFFELKKKRGVLDFSDVEHLCLQALALKSPDAVLRPSAVALQLKNK